MVLPVFVAYVTFIFCSFDFLIALIICFYILRIVEIILFFTNIFLIDVYAENTKNRIRMIIVV